MKYIKTPVKSREDQLTTLQQDVRTMLQEIANQGDAAVQRYAKGLDNDNRSTFAVTKAEIEKAYASISPEILDALAFAMNNITEFTLAQKQSLLPLDYTISDGITLGHRIIPLQSCGCYVPGGRYPLPSSALMSIVPAKVAGVKRIVACSPPDRATGSINPITLVAMDLAGADEILCLGGVQAIGALAYGTSTIEPVDKIVGPGNQYVAEAKRQVYGQVDIDFIAGPSEVLVIADETGNPSYIAADLLAQCEHDPLAKSMLITTSKSLAEKTLTYIDQYLDQLSTTVIAKESWMNLGEVIIVDTLEEAIDYSNLVAPEHLEIQVANEEEIIPQLTNYGGLFIGNQSAEVFGDYVAGTNHILPTSQAARYTGGVWVGSFVKVVSYQKISSQGLAYLIQPAATIAAVEGLDGHRLASLVRKTVNDNK